MTTVMKLLAESFDSCSDRSGEIRWSHNKGVVEALWVMSQFALQFVVSAIGAKCFCLPSFTPWGP